MSPSTTIFLPSSIHAAIIAHALEGAPEEVCGILSGRDGVATELVRGRNEAANRIMDFWVDGQTLLKQFDFEDRGEEMIAIYHSHPAGAAYPSATDARYAFYPDAAYLICSLARPAEPVIRAFRLRAQDLDQRPADVQPVRGDPRFLAQLHRRCSAQRPDPSPPQPIRAESDCSGLSPAGPAATAWSGAPAPPHGDYYDLVVIAADGQEHWQRVHVVELAIAIAPEHHLLDNSTSAE